MSLQASGKYIDRTYRSWVTDKQNLVNLRITTKETDLLVRVSREASEGFNLRRKIESIVLRERKILEFFVRQYPKFKTSFEPIDIPVWAPWIAKRMQAAAQIGKVGPMAAVAGALADAVGEELATISTEVIVENGGDIFITSDKPQTVAVFAGESPFTGILGLRFLPKQFPLGVCSSSGTIGPSISFGAADCALVLAKSATLADAAATALGNRILSIQDLKPAVEWALTLPGVTGALAIKGDHLAIQGDVNVVKLSKPRL